LYISMYMLTDF